MFLILLIDSTREKHIKSILDWIDHIAVIKSSEIINQLDAILLEKLNALELDKIWMAVPDVVDWDVIHELKLNSRGSAV